MVEEERFVSKWQVRKKRLGGITILVVFIFFAGAMIWIFVFSGFDICMFIEFVAALFLGLVEGEGWGLILLSDASKLAKGIVVGYDGISVYGDLIPWGEVRGIYRNPDRRYITIVARDSKGERYFRNITKSKDWGDRLVSSIERMGAKVLNDTFYDTCRECGESISGPGPYCEECAKELEEKRRIEELKREAMA